MSKMAGDKEKSIPHNIIKDNVTDSSCNLIEEILITSCKLDYLAKCSLLYFLKKLDEKNYINCTCHFSLLELTCDY